MVYLGPLSPSMNPLAFEVQTMTHSVYASPMPTPDGVFRGTPSKGHEAIKFSESVLFDMFDTCRLLYRHRSLLPCVAGGALWAWAADVVPRDIDIFLGRGRLGRGIGMAWHGWRLGLRYGEFSSQDQPQSPPDPLAPPRGPFAEQLVLDQAVRTTPSPPSKTTPKTSDPYGDPYSFTTTLVEAKAISPQNAEGVHSDEQWDGRIRRFHTATRRGTPVDLVLTGCRYGSERVANFDYKHVRVGWAPGNPAGMVRLYEGAWYYMRGIIETVQRRSRVRPEEVIRRKLQESLWGQSAAGQYLEAVFNQLSRCYLAAAAEEVASDIACA